MKKWMIIAIVILAIALIGFNLIGTYNRLVVLNESVDNAWAQVENQLQRRSDLIPNLVATVQGFADHEQEVINSVTEARSKLGGAGSIDESIEAAQGLDSALSRLLVVVENYPDIKANENFRLLMDQLEGTENRLAVERQRFNDQVAEYNTIVKVFPTNIYANIFNLGARSYYEPPQADLENPEVSFN